MPRVERGRDGTIRFTYGGTGGAQQQTVFTPTVRVQPARTTRMRYTLPVVVFLLIIALPLTIGTVVFKNLFDLGKSTGSTGTGTGAGTGNGPAPKPSLSPNRENIRGNMHVVFRKADVLSIATPWESYVDDNCLSIEVYDPLLKTRIANGHYVECTLADSRVVFYARFYRFNSQADQEAYHKDLDAKWKQCQNLTDSRASRSGVRCLGKGKDPEDSSPVWIYWDSKTEPVGAQLLGEDDAKEADLKTIWDTYA